ncbi:MAG: glycosyltransferase family 2 protein [Candidatus Hydrogenedentota bacterium]
MRKLIIQIPCFNEEDTLAETLADLPRDVPGFDAVEYLVIDDGSTDRTSAVARENGAHHVVQLRMNRGLARAFMTGLNAAVCQGADVIVNTDADNQYHAGDIPALVQPILDGHAEIVVGERPIAEIAHWSPLKKVLQSMGSWVVRMASGTHVTDAPSGFRAFTREAAMRINVFDNYTYTLETIIQAGRKNMAITSVPVRVNGETRPSRLISSIPTYIRRSVFTIVRIFMTYRPFRFFSLLAACSFFVGLVPALRFLVFWAAGQGEGHIQSLIFSAIFVGGGFVFLVTALLADLIAVNRQLLEDVRTRQRELEQELRRSREGS